jgi:hypothetical protein
MRIEPHIVDRHWEAAAAEQIEETLRAQGYEVKRNGLFDDLRADLVARRGDETLVCEIKSPREGGKAWAREVARLRERAVARGARFHLVFVRPPRESRIEIEGIASILEEALSTHMPDQLRALVGNAANGEVSQVTIDRIEVRPHEMEVGGEATVTVDLRSHEGGFSREDFPFMFEILLDRDGRLTNVVDLQVDLSTLLGRPGASKSRGKKPPDRGGA